MSGDGDLLGKAQSLLDALREKGLHLPNPTRVDGDADALASLAEEVRAFAADVAPTFDARFDAAGILRVALEGALRGRVAVVEARAFAPWREEARVTRVACAPAGPIEVVLEGVERDGPVNVVLRDVTGCPVAWRTLEAT